MRDETAIVRERQLLVRREMDRRGISLKAVQLDGGWSTLSTVQSYFPNPEGTQEPQTMSIAALYRLLDKGALPSDLLSLLLPDNYLILQVPEGVDYDEVSSHCRDFIDAKEKAHHPESEAGRDIGPTENTALSGKVLRLKS